MPGAQKALSLVAAVRWLPLERTPLAHSFYPVHHARTASDASLARFLEDRLASENIHLDFSVSIER